MKIWKLPLWSRVAGWAASKLPNRVLGHIWLHAYDELDLHYRDVKEMEDDGYTLLESVSAIQVESMKRRICRDVLKAELQERKTK